VVDHKPARSTDDERSTLLLMLRYQRESLVRKVDGISDDDARRSPVASGTNLLWLLNHLAHAEILSVEQRFAGAETPLPEPADTVAGAVASYRRAWSTVDARVAAAALDTVAAAVEEPVNLRWILVHLVQETARHAGHADVLAELLDGRTGR
jgi:uncharacterized damage-inducible protein DinB